METFAAFNASLLVAFQAQVPRRVLEQVLRADTFTATTCIGSTAYAESPFADCVAQVWALLDMALEVGVACLDQLSTLAHHLHASGSNSRSSSELHLLQQNLLLHHCDLLLLHVRILHWLLLHDLHWLTWLGGLPGHWHSLHLLLCQHLRWLHLGHLHHLGLLLGHYRRCCFGLLHTFLFFTKILLLLK